MIPLKGNTRCTPICYALIELAKPLEPRHLEKHEAKYNIHNGEQIKTRLQDADIPGIGLQKY